MLAPLLVITNVAIPALEVHAPVAVKTGGGGGGNQHAFVRGLVGQAEEGRHGVGLSRGK